MTHSIRSAFVVFLFGVVLLLTACGMHASEVRRSYYRTPLPTMVAVTEEVIAAHYPFRIERRGPDAASYRVGPLWFDADRQRLTAVSGEVPTGAAYRVVLVIHVRGHDDGRFLDILPAASRRTDRGWTPYATSRPLSEFNQRDLRGTDRFAHDTFLASVADPIYYGVYARLAGVATDPPAM